MRPSLAWGVDQKAEAPQTCLCPGLLTLLLLH